MTKQQLATYLNGRERGEEISEIHKQAAKDNGLVVVFGASDDLMEFEGAIYDEIGVYGGGEARLIGRELIGDGDVCESECKYYQAAVKNARKINALWGAGGYTWSYETDIPHETFEIFEDGSPYCKGIVFSLDDLS